MFLLQVDQKTITTSSYDASSYTGLNEDETGDGEGDDGRENSSEGLDRLAVDGGEEGGDLSESKPGPRCILEFSLAKILAYKTATKIRKIRSRKIRNRQRKLNGPCPDVNRVSPEEECEAAGSDGEAEEEGEDGEVNKRKRGPKIMVSLWPMGKKRGKNSDCIPLVMRREGGEEEEEEEEAEGDIDAEGVPGGSEGGQSPKDGSTESKNETCEIGGNIESGNEDDDINTDDESSMSRHQRHCRQSMVFMNLVRDFMEDRLIQTHRRSRVCSHDHAELTTSIEEYNRTRGRGVRGVEVQCDDMWATMTDEELIARIVVRNTVTKAVALEKELLSDKGSIHAAASNIADKLLAKIDDNARHIKADADQRLFRIRLEPPAKNKSDPSVVNLRLEYLVDDESENETVEKSGCNLGEKSVSELGEKSESELGEKLELVRQKGISPTVSREVRTSVHDASGSPLEVASEMRTFEPLPPIGSMQGSEEIGLINPATTCSSEIFCKYYF